MSKKQKFIGYTAGLLVSGHGKTALVKAEYSRNEDGTVSIKAVSGHNLNRMGGSATLSAEQFEDRPTNPYNDTQEAIWALRLLGYSVGGDDA